ncbi:ubiquitin-like-conjugating enzyme ATG10 [Sergentomyia squamirostris]
MTPEEFKCEAIEFVKISDKLKDSWELKSVKNSLQEDVVYVVKRGTKVKCGGRIVAIEFHVIHQVSYQVPVLGLNTFTGDGSSISHEDIWSLLQIEDKSRDFLSVLTQMDHPALFTPLWTLHPCRTADLIEGVRGNKIIGFLSAMGPTVGLHLDLAYGMTNLLE